MVVRQRSLYHHILSVIIYTYIPENLGFCSHYYCTVCDVCKYSNTLRAEVRICLSAHYTSSLSSLCKLIWRHWTYKCLPGIFYCVCVWNKVNSLHHLLCNIWDCAFSAYPFLLWWLLEYMGQVSKLWLSCYLVLLSIDSKTRQQDSHSFATWPIYTSCYYHYQIGSINH